MSGQFETPNATFTEHSVIGQAADLIVEHGHCVGHLVDGEGRLCALGAMSLVIYGDPITGSADDGGSSTERGLYFDAIAVLMTHLTATGDDTYRMWKSVSDWSDRAGQDAVVAAMRAAAAGG